ncbi:MAG: DNA polymerase III subunit epsilon [Hydrogenophilaceae bacterium]|jgi:DNA polymerase-3 subunit epsilon|nr:DNA polymerase III subunit epsilon [Hydrogenophilaceae bacterium]
MREVVFDTETTGRDPLSGDRIVEIACVELVKLSPTGRTFHRYINPMRDVPDEVVRVHGLTARFLADKPAFSDPTVVDELLDFFEDSPLVAHNAQFDRGFLNQELEMAGRAALPLSRFVDTLAIAREKFRGAANSLDALAKRFMLDRDGFDLSARKGPGGHGALVDSKILARVYLELRGGREQALDFADEPALETTEQGRIVFPARARRAAPLAPRLTEEERAAHAAFVEELGGQALWRKVAA